jgi:hypothetical protein
MTLISFPQAQARGMDREVFVNPECVSAVLPVHHTPEGGWDSENRAIIVLKLSLIHISEPTRL